MIYKRENFIVSWDEAKAFIFAEYRVRISDNIREKYYLPIIERIFSEKKKKSKPMIIGILGGQGSGKSVLATFLKKWFSLSGYPALAISLDDYYSSYEDRKKFSEENFNNPFYQIARGLPATHRTCELYTSLLAAGQGKSFYRPIFEKNLLAGKGDIVGEELLNSTVKAEFIFFEGWFTGLPVWESEIAESFFKKDTTICSIIDELDVNREYLKMVKQNLQKYEKIWKLIDYQICLFADSITNIVDWRFEQEQNNFRQSGISSGLSRQDIQEFCKPFLPLTYLAEKYFSEELSSHENLKYAKANKEAIFPFSILTIAKNHQFKKIVFSN